ncbi:MAG: peptide deformylase [Actinomycetota bacterium]|nr:peptide deformylase [Actinomycetota bacterium]
MSLFPIREFGDPVLRSPAVEVTEFDADLKRLADDMLETMYDAPGVGLAAPQIGVQKRMFVYDDADGSGPGEVINPVLSGHQGEWDYTEGCLSVPDLHWPILRPERVHLDAFDVDGKPFSLDGEELMARMLQHEVDHLDGILLLQRLDPVLRKEAMKTLRLRALGLNR